jgi:hypothetical protein
MFGSIPYRFSFSDRTNSTPREHRVYRHGSEYPISPGRDSIDLGTVSPLNEALGVFPPEK